MRTLWIGLALVACSKGKLSFEDDPPTGGDDSAAPQQSGDTSTPAPTADTVPPTDTTDSAPPVVDACTFDDGQVDDLWVAGPSAYTTSTLGARVNGCELDPIVFAPRTGRHDALVILSHGFQRSPDVVLDWAEHLSSWGFEVWVPALCHARIGDTDHAQNGRDLAALAEREANGRPVIYVGHSAGGLASVIAGTEDDDTVGVFGLDLVDTGDLGRDSAAAVSAPVWGLRGAPSAACNVNGNGRPVYRRAVDGRVAQLVGATHCDFESPTNVVCTALCDLGENNRFSDAAQRRVIKAMTTAFAMHASGVEPDALRYWTPGCDRWDAYAATGILR